MAFVVEMFGGELDTQEFRNFSCSAWVWEETLQLARNHGWQPLGTSPDPIWQDQGNAGAFSGNYDCDDATKFVAAPDAAALADALERAAKEPIAATKTGPILLREGITAGQYGMANAPLGDNFLREFIDFLRKGEFSFFWDINVAARVCSGPHSVRSAREKSSLWVGFRPPRGLLQALEYLPEMFRIISFRLTNRIS
jgi:hypothetical protein